jgi:FkbH-like protein
MEHLLDYPFDPQLILRKKKKIKQILLQKPNLTVKRVAILGGSTTAEIKNMLELFLLRGGITPDFYESEYNKYYEDAMFGNSELSEFSPEVVYIHTTGVNVRSFPTLSCDENEVTQLLEEQVSLFRNIWEQLETYNCLIVQNNFELPYSRPLGNHDISHISGKTQFISRLNQKLIECAKNQRNVIIHDLNYLASWFGLERWHNQQLWYAYKYAMAYEAIPFLAHSLASNILTAYGKSRKCLVLDLDNTLWGGTVGNDGVNGIMIGEDNPKAQAYRAFQRYVKMLKERGILLAACSKNELDDAKAGFSHPDSILELDDFVAFKANWNPKHQNIEEIARELNIGLDSLVFVDDNPVERELVRSQLSSVAVPDMGKDIANYILILDKAAYFETLSLSSEDTKRHIYYKLERKRGQHKSRFESHDEFLASLEMKAEIKPFSPVYLERISQLINKTNQFNLTTIRYTLAQVEEFSENPTYTCLYGKLTDKFGDNGLVSVIIANIKEQELHINLWVLSCRVFQRGMEGAVLDELVAFAQKKNIRVLWGYFRSTPKNKIVRDLYGRMGFTCTSSGSESENESVWMYNIPVNYDKHNQVISVNQNTSEN